MYDVVSGLGNKFRSSFLRLSVSQNQQILSQPKKDEKNVMQLIVMLSLLIL